ncbi:MAG: serine/threonine-protein kinase [Acidobacteria bacterium]|nr:serine/threonine-protein kinase [Acidobacteriota bacterium]
MLLKGQSLGKYKILASLGSGGFGAVYLAKDTWIDKEVAIKVPHKQNLNFAEHLREPRLLAALDHPNIVSITTAEKTDNVFFIVMEYVAGETLDDLIARDGALAARRLIGYATQLARAVDHAHRQGVVHRDLRPSNVLVSSAGVLKVTDFGTSRFLEMAAHNTVTGSPPYMAPEQFEGRAVFASDIYSLGVTMYQMATGGLPYDTPTQHDLVRLRRGELVQPPRLRKPDLPQRLNDLIMKALAPDVPSRYQRADELLRDLERARAAGPEVASPAPARGAEAGDRTAEDQRRAKSPRRTRTPSSRFCWQCLKPLHARANRCPFCGQMQ